MKLLSDWGFTTTSWQGQRGEYWVVGQAILLVGLGLLPAWPVMAAPAAPLRAAVWAIAAGVAALGAVLLGKGLLEYEVPEVGETEQEKEGKRRR